METVPQLQIRRPRPFEVIWNNGFILFNTRFLSVILVEVAILRLEDTLTRLSFSISFLSGLIQLVGCYKEHRNHDAVLAVPTESSIENGEKGLRFDARDLDQEIQAWSEPKEMASMEQGQT